MKAAVGHGNFLPWIDAKFGWKKSTAENFMNVAERIGPKNPSLGNFTCESLYLLSAKSEPAREEAVKLAESGKKVTHTI